MAAIGIGAGHIVPLGRIWGAGHDGLVLVCAATKITMVNRSWRFWNYINGIPEGLKVIPVKGQIVCYRACHEARMAIVWATRSLSCLPSLSSLPTSFVERGLTFACNNWEKSWKGPRTSNLFRLTHGKGRESIIGPFHQPPLMRNPSRTCWAVHVALPEDPALWLEIIVDNWKHAHSVRAPINALFLMMSIERRWELELCHSCANYYIRLAAPSFSLDMVSAFPNPWDGNLRKGVSILLSIKQLHQVSHHRLMRVWLF